ncbi:hypothetical protein ACU8DI_13445 [Psychroserpens sp. BH13MA-6]
MLLQKTFQKFQVVSCQLHHERVALNAQNKPRFKQLDRTITFDRIPLCPKNLRSHRLGCAHSKVNIDFDRLLEQLLEALPKQQEMITSFKQTFNQLIACIYELDHKKGQLEHDLALSELHSDGNQTNELQKDMNIVLIKHQESMDALELLRSDIERLIDEQVNIY